MRRDYGGSRWGLGLGLGKARGREGVEQLRRGPGRSGLRLTTALLRRRFRRVGEEGIVEGGMRAWTGDELESNRDLTPVGSEKKHTEKMIVWGKKGREGELGRERARERERERERESERV
ncbi:uncharacterized protein CIMG_03477 [Coccidioides immitis RS]|uniref:Uncharacterized protein n=1 Tax=Coccidioides immitis (strain RS) TaxID=246410 RepID=A0A0E1RWQ2_COCIM|nr:uncharacterized protein CIMG_03477 [Coccidioides immitis RS]EAS32453.1 hypothetical protein CIMG_03477 [Coccidioides immitis RS]